jgi:hypothetical protein
VPATTTLNTAFTDPRERQETPINAGDAGGIRDQGPQQNPLTSRAQIPLPLDCRSTTGHASTRAQRKIDRISYHW